MKGANCLTTGEAGNYLEAASTKDMGIVVFGAKMSSPTLIHHINSPHRSFEAVGFSASSSKCLSETRNINNCETSPTYEGGINSVNVTCEGVRSCQPWANGC